MKRVYPAIFTQTKNGYLIEVPDLEILTQGSDLFNAIEMARDAISITIVVMEENKDTIPGGSNLKDIDVASGEFAGKGKSFVSMVDIDTDAYRSKTKMTDKIS